MSEPMTVREYILRRELKQPTAAFGAALGEILFTKKSLAVAVAASVAVTAAHLRPLYTLDEVDALRKQVAVVVKAEYPFFRDDRFPWVQQEQLKTALIEAVARERQDPANTYLVFDRRSTLEAEIQSANHYASDLNIVRLALLSERDEANQKLKQTSTVEGAAFQQRRVNKIEEFLGYAGGLDAANKVADQTCTITAGAYAPCSETIDHLQRTSETVKYRVLDTIFPAEQGCWSIAMETKPGYFENWQHQMVVLDDFFPWGPRLAYIPHKEYSEQYQKAGFYGECLAGGGFETPNLVSNAGKPLREALVEKREDYIARVAEVLSEPNPPDLLLVKNPANLFIGPNGVQTEAYRPTFAGTVTRWVQNAVHKAGLTR